MLKTIPKLRKNLVRDLDYSTIKKELEIYLTKPTEEVYSREYQMILDKPRISYAYSDQHQVIHALMAECLENKIQPFYAHSLASYQKGKSVQTVFDDLKHYLHEYKLRTPQIKQRQLHVIRWDIQSYSESIPLHESSSLWKNLKTVLESDASLSLQAQLWLKHLKAELRPIVMESTLESNHGPFQLYRGIPCSSPLNPILVNLYLAELDRAIEKQYPEVFYRRFCDDCVLIHPDETQVKNAYALFQQLLESKELQINKNKILKTTWQASHLAEVEFLGRSIHFKSTLFFKKKKIKEILSQFQGVFLRTLQFNDYDFTLKLWQKYWETFVVRDLPVWINCTERFKNFNDRLVQVTAHKLKKRFPESKQIYQQLHQTGPFAQWQIHESKRTS
jgi:hypothetical protein